MKRKSNNQIQAIPTEAVQHSSRNLPKGAKFILEDGSMCTSYEFQLYNFAMGILFLMFGLNVISGTMMLINVCIAFVHFDLGLETYDVAQLWNRVQVVLGLCALIFLYMLVLWDNGISVMAEGYTGSGLFLLAGVVGTETYLWDVCSKTSRQLQAADRATKRKKKSNL